MTISTSLVFEQTAAESTFERQFVAVDLLVALQVTQATEGLVTELAGVGQPSPSLLLSACGCAQVTAVGHLRGGRHVFTGGRGRHPGQACWVIITIGGAVVGPVLRQLCQTVEVLLAIVTGEYGLIVEVVVSLSILPVLVLVALLGSLTLFRLRVFTRGTDFCLDA